MRACAGHMRICVSIGLNIWRALLEKRCGVKEAGRVVEDVLKSEINNMGEKGHSR